MQDIKCRGRTEQSVITQWQATVDPMHKEFCDPSRLHAQEIVHGDAEIEMSELNFWQIVGL